MCLAAWQRAESSPRFHAAVGPSGQGIRWSRWVRVEPHPGAAQRTSRRSTRRARAADGSCCGSARSVITSGRFILRICSRNPDRVGTGRFWTVLHVQRPAGLLVDEHPAQQGGAQQPDVLSGERTVAVHHAGFAGQLQHGAHRHEHVEHHLRAHLDTGTCHPTRDRAVLGGEDHRREGGEQVRPALLRGALHPRLPVADALLLLQGVQTGAPAGQLLRGQHRPGQSQPVRLWAVRRVPPGGGIGVALLRRCWTVLLGLDPQQRAGHQPAQIRRAQQCPVGEHLRLDLRRAISCGAWEVTCSSTAACAVSSSPRSSIPNVTGNAAYRSASSSQRDAVSWPTRNDPATSNGKNRRVPSVPLNAARRTTARIREPSCRASARRLSSQPSSNGVRLRLRRAGHEVIVHVFERPVYRNRLLHSLFRRNEAVERPAWAAAGAGSGSG